MQISNSAYMGVEVLVRLAAYEPNRCCTAQALAEWICRSLSHTETLLSRLRAAGLVRASRGHGGGYQLGKPADSRRQSTDETLAVGDPPELGNQLGHRTLAHVWFRAHGSMLAIRNYLDKAVYPKYSLVSILNLL